MCITPQFYQPSQRKGDKRGVTVACRYCWQCRKTRVNDYVGRCIAEQKTATDTVAVTLTYADRLMTDETKCHTVALVYADVQKMIKRLRKDGYRVRYIVAGEYGTKKGRAHWHGVLFFHGKKTPKRVQADEIAPSLNENTDPFSQPKFTDKITNEHRMFWKYWPHGFVYFERPDYNGFSYALKYALKDLTATVSTGHLAMSKKPPLGTEFFMQLAKKHVEQGLAPQSPEYSFRDHFDADGKRRKFWLKGKVRELFVERFLDLWRTRYSSEPPLSEFTEAQEDKWIRDNQEWEYDETHWTEYLGDKVRQYEHRRDALAPRRVYFPDVGIAFLYAGLKLICENKTTDGEYQAWHVNGEASANQILRALRSDYRLSLDPFERVQAEWWRDTPADPASPKST